MRELTPDNHQSTATGALAAEWVQMMIPLSQNILITASRQAFSPTKKDLGI